MKNSIFVSCNLSMIVKSLNSRIFGTLFAAFLSCIPAALSAQDGAYGSMTPYSIYGIGDLSDMGSAYNRSMGGTGIASRNNRFMNYTNPAAVTARDSLAFMIDMSLFQDNKVFRQGDMKSGSNTFNLNDLAISFPIYRSSAMMVGIRPYSNVGYEYGYLYTDPALIGKTGNIGYSATGQGSLYQLFASAGVTFWKKLSLGAEWIYHFGSIERLNTESFGEASYNGAENGYNMKLHATAAKVGIQYEEKVGTSGKLCIGATYKTAASMKGFVEGFEFSTGSASSDTLSYSLDTLQNTPGKVKIAGELGIGIAYNCADRWRAELDYTRSDWTSTGMDSVGGFAGNAAPVSGFSGFSAAVSQSFRAGFEITPNRNDIRYYYKKITYRAGAYYKNEYFKLDGRDISSTGITLGATLPVFRWYNGLTLGVDFGQRGNVRDNAIRERYVNFSLGVNLFDIWFRKQQYE